MTPPSNAFDRLAALVASKGPVCLGFDPRVDQAPKEFLPASSKAADAARSIVGFFDAILDAATPFVSAVKLQAAFFERHLAPGFEAFVACCRAARERGLFVVADVKRGDIGTTSEAYAEAYLSKVDDLPPLADVVTVNPYLGSDGIDPFVEAAKKNGGGIFALVKTSNPSSRELQDLRVDGRSIAERVALALNERSKATAGTNGYGVAGSVVGATHPEELGAFRKLAPHSWFLLPGYGAQGAGPEDVVAAFDAKGLGAIVAASRSLTYPWGKGAAPSTWRADVAEAARRMRDEIRAAVAGRAR
jgi:orotidine-5'-phosphate decarboxylase